jgi:hypothetical protein
LNSSPNIWGDKIVENGMFWTCGKYWGREGMRKVLVGNREVNRQLGRPKSLWECIINLDHQELECGCWDFIELSQDRDRRRALVNMVMNYRIP